MRMILKTALTALFLASLSPSLLAKNDDRSSVVCENKSLDEFKKIMGQNSTEEIVFFASWCASCKDHIKEANKRKSLFVVAFDQKDKAQQAINAILTPEEQTISRCIFDESTDIRQEYNASYLPFRVKIKN